MASEDKPAKPPLPYVTPLKELCIRVVAENFSQRSDFGQLPPLYVKRVIDLLSTDLPLELVGGMIDDEAYWKRRACATWKNLECVEHGSSWKQLYFERNLESALERYDPATSDPNKLKQLLAFSKRFARNLRVTQLPSHLDLQMLFDQTASCLASLKLTYGMQDVGMDYDRSLFGMKLTDCRALAKALEKTETLTHLDLSGNMLDDDKVRMVASGMVDNLSVTHLNLSHNKIADRGVRALAKLMDQRSIIAHMDLRDNQIHTEGGRAIARALRTNTSLLELNLRLNRLGDEGASAILEVLGEKNQTLQRLNLSSNALEKRSSSAISNLLKSNATLLELDLACNFFTPECGKQIRDGLEQNTVLRHVDLRMCNVGTDVELAAADVLTRNQAAVGTDGGMGHAGTLMPGFKAGAH